MPPFVTGVLIAALLVAGLLLFAGFALWTIGLIENALAELSSNDEGNRTRERETSGF